MQEKNAVYCLQTLMHVTAGGLPLFRILARFSAISFGVMVEAEELQRLRCGNLPGSFGVESIAVTVHGPAAKAAFHEHQTAGAVHPDVLPLDCSSIRPRP